MSDFEEQATALIVQRRQTDEAQGCLNAAGQALDDVAGRQRAMQDELDSLLAMAEAAVRDSTVILDGDISEIEALDVEPSRVPIAPLDHVGIGMDDDWDAYYARVSAYVSRKELKLSDDPFAELLSPSQRIALEKRIREDFSLKNANCDRFDYMIAGTCGLIGGLVDVLFVGIPGEGPLTKVADALTDDAVQKIAKLLGWPGPNEGSNPVASAIGYLENKFDVPYDHSTSKSTGNIAKNMRPKNHRIKSIGHWPDIVGLLFSILDQFCSTAHFVSDGNIVSTSVRVHKDSVIYIDEEWELQGSTFVAKVFAGFVNWLGHLISDVAGTENSAGEGKRGSGIPIPLYGLLQFINFGEFTKIYRDKDGNKVKEIKIKFARVAVEVFEQGYDFRHGMALAIPVLITELLTRIMWTFKRKFYHGSPWGGCIPSANNPELRRMLLVGHGTLCIVDGTDALLQSGGEIIQIMLRVNLIGWARFGTLALKELKAWSQAGGLDVDAVDAYLDSEYERLLIA